MTLSYAISKGSTKIVDALLSSDSLNEHSKNLGLIYAARYGDVDCIKKLIDHGADIGYCDSKFSSPLYQTIVQNKYDAFNFLVSMPHIDLESRLLHAKNPLLMTAYYDRPEMFQSLLSKGVDLEAVSSKDYGLLI